MSDRRNSPIDRRSAPPDQAPAPSISADLIIWRMDQQDEKLDRILEQVHKTNGRVTVLETKEATREGRQAGAVAVSDWQLKLLAAFIGLATLGTGIITLVTQ